MTVNRHDHLAGLRVCKLKTFTDDELSATPDGEVYESLRDAMDFGWKLLGPPRRNDDNTWTWYLQR